MDKLKVGEDEDEEMEDANEEEEEEEEEDAALEDVKDLYEDEEGTGKKRKRPETDDGDEKVGKKKVRPSEPNNPTPSTHLSTLSLVPRTFVVPTPSIPRIPMRLSTHDSYKFHFEMIFTVEILRRSTKETKTQSRAKRQRTPQRTQKTRPKTKTQASSIQASGIPSNSLSALPRRLHPTFTTPPPLHQPLVDCTHILDWDHIHT